MQYRDFGKKIEFKVSALGFGTMRLPIIGTETKNIDEDMAIRMIRVGIDKGINYLDTAYGYHDGMSEVLVGKALKDGYRDKVNLATKLPPWFINNKEDMDRILNEQLTRLQTDHIDFYLLHALNRNSWPKLKELGVIPWINEMKAQGKIRHLGFSFHDDTETFKKIVDDYDEWVFCQVQNNFMDIHEQAGTEGIQYAGSKGLAVIIMEPLRGGQLTNPMDTIQSVWNKATAKRSPVEWALDWLWNQPEVSVVLSGMSTMEQVEQNLEYADHSSPQMLTPDEVQLVEQVRIAYNSLIQINCTACKYCMPCPNGVAIPSLFGALNEASMYGTWKQKKRHYQHLLKEGKAVEVYTQCGVCEEKCPQHLKIPELLQIVKKQLG